MDTPGRGLLKVAGILGIIFGCINSIMILYGLMTADFWDAVMPAAGGFSWRVYYFFAFIVVAYGIYASIMAIVHCATLEKGSFLGTLGIIGIVLVVIMGIVDMNAFGASALVMLPINLVLPILYIVGATMNDKAPQTAYSGHSGQTQHTVSTGGFCTSCGIKLPVSGNAAFCPNCGAKIWGGIQCKSCNREYEATLRSCPHCAYRPNAIYDAIKPTLSSLAANTTTTAVNSWICANCSDKNAPNVRICKGCGKDRSESRSGAKGACPVCGVAAPADKSQNCPKCGNKL